MVQLAAVHSVPFRLRLSTMSPDMERGTVVDGADVVAKNLCETPEMVPSEYFFVRMFSCRTYVIGIIL